MSAIEKALKARLVKEGRMISTTAVPDGWLADGELIADARWIEESQPLKIVN
ncbi:MAG TPA: hypothetical protein PK735_14105 [Flavobacteriales bacterium]|nr:hypothetical protein [Flavobacteriales bacterium]